MSEYTTYDDDLCFGKAAPSFETLDFLTGEQFPQAVQGKTCIVYFCAKYYKGGQFVSDEMSALAKKYTDAIFIGISGDAERAQVERYLEKKVLCENTGRQLMTDLPFFCFDANGVVRRQFSEKIGGAAVSIPQAFVIDRNGKLVWRQVFSQNLLISQTDFEAQIKHVMNGEELESHGNKPKVDCGEAEEAEADDMSLF